MQSILNNDQLYVDKYFSTFNGYYNTGDSGMVDKDGYFAIMSRVDDVINTAGHRLSTGEMEQAMMLHPKIAEAIVIGAQDEVKG
jgi:propionyl-CoA synthetase